MAPVCVQQTLVPKEEFGTPGGWKDHGEGGGPLLIGGGKLSEREGWGVL